MSSEKSLTPQIRFKGFTEAWEQRKLGELMEVTSVRRVHQDDWTTQGVRFLRARDLVAYANNTEIELPLYISKELYEKYTAQSGKVEIGDLLVTGVGTIGVPWLVETPSPVYFKDGNIIWFKNKNVINGKYFYYAFTSASIQKFIKESAGTGTVGTYTIDTGKKTPIYIPSTFEQHKIASTMKRFDSLITLHQRKLDALKKIKSALLEKMFPKDGSNIPEIRFTGFTEAWEQRKLGELMEVTSVRRVHQDDWTTQGVRFLRARDLVAYANNTEIELPLYISKELYEKYTAQSGKVEIGDLLVTGVGTIGVPWLVETPSPVYFKDGNIIWFKNKNVINGKYFYYAFTSASIQKFIKESAGTGTVGTYTIDTGKKTPIYIPSTFEQHKIASTMKRFDSLITLHQRKLDALKKIKSALLEKMFV